MVFYPSSLTGYGGSSTSASIHKSWSNRIIDTFANSDLLYLCCRSSAGTKVTIQLQET